MIVKLHLFGTETPVLVQLELMDLNVLLVHYQEDGILTATNVSAHHQ